MTLFRIPLFGAAATALVSMMLALPHEVRATDCAASSGVLTPATAPDIDCPAASRPCQPNACTCYGGTCAAGPSAAATGSLYSGCGPITTCVLLGADPPISNTLWKGTDLEGQGPPGSARMISGKCPPPNDNGDTTCPTCPAGEVCGTMKPN